VKLFATLCSAAVAASLLYATASARGQTSASDRFKALTDPEGVEKALDKAAKDKLRPPYEFFRSQVAPFDVLPYVKTHHWNTLSLELRSNMGGYEGYLRSAPVKLLEMPHAVSYRRDARLIQDQTQRLSLQLMFPSYFKELSVELTRADAIRPDALWSAPLLKLEPHQMLVPILSQDSAQYANWSKLNALIPSSGDKDAMAIDKQRYYRPVLGQDAEKPALSAHPLTWTTISHLIWDDYSPEFLNSGQQQAMIDWLHWGGQLIIVSRVGSSLAPLQEGFLSAYLPATPSGKNFTLKPDELAILAEKYRAPLWPGEWQDMLEANGVSPQVAMDSVPPRYHRPEVISAPPTRPVILTGLTPAEGSTPIYLDKEDGPMLAVERRVGRGRITVVAFRPTDPSLIPWGGFDTLVRRVVMRRQEEVISESERRGKSYAFLNAQKLCWFRLLGRDLNAAPPPETQNPSSGETVMPQEPVAAWVDTNPAGLPVSARKALEVASGITIPPHTFVLRVMLAYIVALVPLNWLVCRYLLRRREMAWGVVPILALGFSFGVERLAARDLGYEFASDEIDLVELQGDYPKAHVNRFVALYSTGRVHANISYPGDPTAIALPMSMQRSLPGEEVVESVFQSSPFPSLVDMPVQPRSLAMFRAEQFAPLAGGIGLVRQDGSRRIVNNSELELRDAVLIDVDRDEMTPIGTIAPGTTVTVGANSAGDEAAAAKKKVDWIDVTPFLERMRDYRWKEPADRGEIRLVAWSPSAMPGQKIEPAVDRPRGFRIVVAHLEYASPPSPSDPNYYTPPTPQDDQKVEGYEVNKPKQR
jgi:hypothetical protein